MKSRLSISLPLGLIVGLVLLAFAAVVLLPSQANAAGSNKNKNTQQTKNQKDQSSDESYSYVAQPGDSYTQMARKAVQTYGLSYNVNLSGAQIIFAETNLTQAADSPYLNVGQKVIITGNSVESWVKKAQKLTKAQQAAWNYYVQFVNFNTDNVGESK